MLDYPGMVSFLYLIPPALVQNWKHLGVVYHCHPNQHIISVL